ncbi:MAG: hypothetical protein E6R09_17440 [Rhodocyclaceae bacterium]|nr:MAG: hypothetical protein E6R09_17440 [Rhodocyclaceae bacterium]
MHIQGMEDHLTQTWEMLVGEHLEFSCEKLQPAELMGQHYFVVTLHPTPSGYLAGVGLAISETDARKATSKMFDLPEAELTSDDIADACAELCNIFAGGVPNHVIEEITLDMGLPSRLEPEQFMLILQASQVTSIYLARIDERKMQVIVFDCLEAPAESGWQPQ